MQNLEDLLRNIYLGFLNGIPIPADEFQHARSTGMIKMNGINSTRNIINEEGWIEMKDKGIKVRFKKQDQFGKTKEVWEE